MHIIKKILKTLGFTIFYLFLLFPAFYIATFIVPEPAPRKVTLETIQKGERDDYFPFVIFYKKTDGQWFFEGYHGYSMADLQQRTDQWQYNTPLVGKDSILCERTCALSYNVSSDKNQQHFQVRDHSDPDREWKVASSYKVVSNQIEPIDLQTYFGPGYGMILFFPGMAIWLIFILIFSNRSLIKRLIKKHLFSKLKA